MQSNIHRTVKHANPGTATETLDRWSLTPHRYGNAGRSIGQRIRQENESLRESGELHRQRIRMLRKARRTDRQKSEALKERLTESLDHHV